MHATVSRIDEQVNFVISSDKALSAAEGTVSGIINAMQFSWSANSFAAGDIVVYGV
jgi:hypothetical protein